MGAGDWVAGGVRRAVSGVAALLPGQPAGADDRPGQASGNPGTPVEPTGTEAQGVGTTPRATGPARKPRVRKAPTAPPPSAPEPGAGTDAAGPAPASTPWSAEELAGFRAALDSEVVRLREELAIGEADLADLVADSGDGSGDDQADAGSKTFEREHEMSVNANTREMLDQAHRALVRLDAGTYGICERCGSPIAAARLRAFPRATLCISCKQAEERR